jgi:hypothetical protein
MKLTESALRNIIRQELKGVLEEGLFDTFKKAVGFGPTEREQYEEARKKVIEILPKVEVESGYKLLADEMGRPIYDSTTREALINAKIKEMFPNVKIPSDRPSISSKQAEKTAAETSKLQRGLTTGVYK